MSRSRMMRAFAVVALLVVAVPASNAAVQLFHNPVTASAQEAGIHAQQLIRLGDAQAVLSRLEGLATPESSELSPVFEGEVGVLQDAADVRVAEFSNAPTGRVAGAGCVVGYQMSDSIPVVYERMNEHMRQRGFTAVPLNESSGTTYIKRDGECRWVLVTYTGVGQQTSVVVRCVYS